MKWDWEETPIASEQKALKMALFEQDREDIFKEALNMPQRIKLRLLDQNEEVVVGTRFGGAVGLYMASGDMFQFNHQRELRRAFFEGLKIMAMDRTLHRLERPSRGGRVEHHSIPLTFDQVQALQLAWGSILQRLRDAPNVVLIAAIPQEQNFPQWYCDWLAQCDAIFSIADRPHVQG